MFKSIFREISHLLRYTDIDMSCSYKSVGVNNNGDITKKNRSGLRIYFY